MSALPAIQVFINHFLNLDLVVNVTASPPNEHLVEEVRRVYNMSSQLVVFTFELKRLGGGTRTYKTLVPEVYCDDIVYLNKVQLTVESIAELDKTVQSLVFQMSKTDRSVIIPEQEMTAIVNTDSNLQDLINRLKELPNVLKVDAYNVIDPTILENVKSDPDDIVVKVMATFRNINDNSLDNTYDVILPKETYDIALFRDAVVKVFNDYISNINII